ncbi:MAG: NUDIX domain-containing protein [Treponema sp.]|nr:NUDIX domain-containing protein [Treponema sp.]
MSELWDVYTVDRKRTGKIIERGMQKTLSDDEFHLWVMCFIKNPVTGKYLISQRAADKDTDPLKWETVAGHVIKGESSLDAALREVQEEVGITFKPEDARCVITKVAKTIDGRRHNWIRFQNMVIKI